MAINYFSMSEQGTLGTSGTGLDQLADIAGNEVQLHYSISKDALERGIAAVNSTFEMIAEAVKATGVAEDGHFTNSDVVKINDYIKEHYASEAKQNLGYTHHGGYEGGYRLLHKEGSFTKYTLKQNVVDDHINTLMHFGQDKTGGRIDGHSLDSFRNVLNIYWNDVSDSGTPLDRLTDVLKNDRKLRDHMELSEREEAASAANEMNKLIAEAVKEVGAAKTGVITADEIAEINAYLVENYSAEFERLYGNKKEGFAQVLGETNTKVFGESVTNTVYASIYRLGMPIENGEVTNHNGKVIASTEDVAKWLTYFLVDQSTTGTGLDQLVDVIKSENMLARNTSVEDLQEGIQAANGLNSLMVEAINELELDKKGYFSKEDIYSINSYIRENHLDEYIRLHGNDENGVETGFHAVQDDGAMSKYGANVGKCDRIYGYNFIDYVMDGLYHIGFEIKGGKFLNEDGEAMHSVSRVANWLNKFYFGDTVRLGKGEDIVFKSRSEGNDVVIGEGGADSIWTYDGDDFVDAGAGNDKIRAGSGNDIIFGGNGKDLIEGATGHDILIGGGGRDIVDGGRGDDVFIISSDSGNDVYKGDKGADKFMIWADGKIGHDRIEKGDRADEIILGGEVDSFRCLKGKKNKNTIEMFDEDGHSLGKLTVKSGLRMDQIRIDKEAFREYEEYFLIAGVDISDDLDALDALNTESPEALTEQIEEPITLAAAEETAVELEDPSLAVGF